MRISIRQRSGTATFVQRKQHSGHLGQTATDQLCEFNSGLSQGQTCNRRAEYRAEGQLETERNSAIDFAVSGKYGDDA
jgi:hypothetical protein